MGGALAGGGPAGVEALGLGDDIDVRGRPLDLVQRQAVAEFAPPPPPVPITPTEDPRFVAVTKGIAGKAAKAKKHLPAKQEAKKAQAAAVPPTTDKEAQAKAAQAEKMAAAKPGGFDKAAFVAAVKKAIAAAAPKTLDEADTFGSSGKADGVKAEVMSKVTKGKEESAGDIKEATKAPPDPSVAKDKPVVPLTPDQPTPPGDPKAARAMPQPAPAEQTQLDGPRRETDAAMADADVTEEQLASSNEPEFQDALKAKKEGEEHSATAPGPVRAAEAQTLAGAKAGAGSQGAALVAAMGASRTAAIGKVGTEKAAAKARDEAARAKVTADINKMYDTTKADVERILSDLDGKVTAKFDTGEAEAKRAFTAEHTQKMRAWKARRYEGVSGKIQWGIDLFKDLPPEANQIFVDARKVYEARMEQVISDVADLIGGELTRAKDRIEKGRAEIRDYVAKLPKDLKKVGNEAAAAVQDKFDQLTADVDSKSEQLVSDLAEKYVTARTAVDEEITKLQEENKGLWSKAKDAVAGVIRTIMKLKDMLLGVLARASGAVSKIVKDPIGFLGNLVSAVSAGVKGFASRIGEHLKKGLLGWLFGELANAGIELPKSFDLKGIVQLVLSLLGVTYANIRSRAVAIVGEKVVGRLEQVADVFKTLVTEGPAGLWKFIIDKVGDLKELVLGQIKEFVITKIVTAGVTWLLSLLNPVSAFIKACKAIYDIIMFLVDKAGQIKEFIDSVLDSVEEIVRGGVGKVAGLIEASLAKLVPLVIGLLASLLGVGGISEKIKSIIQTIQKPINKAIDGVIKGALKMGKRFLGGGKKLLDKGKALLSKGKAYVKGKVEAGKKWVKGKVAAGKAALGGLRDRLLGITFRREFEANGEKHTVFTRKGKPSALITASNPAPSAEAAPTPAVKTLDEQFRGLIDQYVAAAKRADRDPAAGEQAAALHARAEEVLTQLVAATKAFVIGHGTSQGDPNEGAKDVGKVGLHGEKPSSQRDKHRLLWLESEHIIPFAAGKNLWRALSLYLPWRGSHEDNAQTTIMLYERAARIKTPADNARSYSFKTVLEASGIARVIARGQRTAEAGLDASEAKDAIAVVAAHLEGIRKDAVARTVDAVRTESQMVEPGATKTNSQRRGNEPAKPDQSAIDRASQIQLNNVIDLVTEEVLSREGVREKAERIQSRRRGGG